MSNDTLLAFGLGLGTRAADGRWLEVFYAAPIFHPSPTVATTLGKVGLKLSTNEPIEATDTLLKDLTDAFGGAGLTTQAQLAQQLRQATRRALVMPLVSDSAIKSTAEAYLKLHLLSHRLTRPNSLNLDGIFAALPNVVWTNDGAVAVDEYADRQLQARLSGKTLSVLGVDKFPRMTDYVIPTGVRIANSSRVRLGAYVGEGTTVMHEGLINFNAGALGPNMVEGRISQGVVVGAHSDLGGSSSTMGTLSGGGNIVISLGEKCLIGANGGTGIPLGDRCTIAAGVYITAGTVVDVLDEERQHVKTVRARELAGASDMLFIQNSQTGRIECRTNRKAIELNAALHAHN